MACSHIQPQIDQLRKEIDDLKEKIRLLKLGKSQAANVASKHNKWKSELVDVSRGYFDNIKINSKISNNVAFSEANKYVAYVNSEKAAFVSACNSKISEFEMQIAEKEEQIAALEASSPCGECRKVDWKNL